MFAVAKPVDRRLRFARWWLQRAVRLDRRPALVTIDVVSWCARWHPLRPQCLERALAQCARLQRQGIPARVCIGVRRGPSGVEPHAWIGENGGVPALADFAAIAVIDPQATASLASAFSPPLPR